jgi:diadenosine tetraphosphatase ApaH/serine/threonine PP2A family protein phosphatase
MTDERHQTNELPDFDLADYVDVTSARVMLKDPKTGATTRRFIDVAGPEHPDRKRLIFATQRRMRMALAKTGKLQVGDPEDDAADQIDMLVASTLGWNLKFRGQDLPFSKEAARALYNDPERLYVREQVQAALNERELFTRSSAAS